MENNIYSSKIWLYSGLPIDNKYEHTIYFGNRELQNNFFTTTAFLKYSFNDYSYVRPNKNSIIINGKRNLYESINYIRFVNDSKYFYAFVDSIEYLNENATIINFTIDSIQTYLLDCDLKKSYIVRSHTVDLTIDGNLQPEPLAVPFYTYDDVTCTRLGVDKDISDELQPLGIAVASPYKNAYQSTPSEGSIYDNIYSGLIINSYDNVDDINEFLNEMSAEGRADSIVSVYMYPSFFPVQYSEIIKFGYYVNEPNTIDGYYPKNKKLFTFPYSCLAISNGNNEIELRYELWEKTERGTYQLNVVGQVQTNPTVTIYPVNYNGKEEDFETQCVLSGYPQCSYNIDSYKQWVATNKVALAVSAINTTGQIVGNIAKQDYITASTTAFNGITSYLQNDYEHKINPVQTRGTSSSSIGCSTGALTYHVRRKTITAEQARIIDGYFSLYGYAINKVDEPIYWLRPVWNFIQVEGLNCIAKIPQNNLKEIKDAFRHGITFWKDGENMLRYDLDNSYN